MEIVELANNLKEYVISKHPEAAIIAIYSSTAIFMFIKEKKNGKSVR